MDSPQNGKEGGESENLPREGRGIPRRDAFGRGGCSCTDSIVDLGSSKMMPISKYFKFLITSKSRSYILRNCKNLIFVNPIVWNGVLTPLNETGMNWCQ